METISQPVDIEKISHVQPSASSPKSQTCEQLEDSSMNAKSSSQLNDSSDSRIWIMKEAAANDIEVDSTGDNDVNGQKMSKNVSENEASEVVLSEEASHQLLQEQLAVLRAERGKLHHETEMLKLKKDKIKLQMNCYTNEIRKQEMEKEKLRLEIKLLQAKVVEDANDVSHYIFVP